MFNEKVNELYDLYSTTPEGLELRQILIKLDRYCTPWMNAFLIEKMKRELLVQLIEKDFIDEPDSMCLSLSE